MDNYENQVLKELELWQKQMIKSPSLFNKATKKLQDKVNNIIPQKVHNAITVAIKQMIRGVLFGAGITTSKPLQDSLFEVREARIMERIKLYKNTAAAEGGITGAGGFVLSLADFPILIGIKIKMLFEIASLYGIDTKDYKERLYILYIFQLAFSSRAKSKEVYLKLLNWHNEKEALPQDINELDWQSFQQEYRDYIDIAKLAQLIPVIGAAVGFLVNYKLLKKLGLTAMNAYRMRLLNAPMSEVGSLSPNNSSRQLD